MTAPMTSREDLAETIHKARWPADRQMAIIPFADEDRSGREYCFRIADAILTRAGLAQSPTPDDRGAQALGVVRQMVKAFDSGNLQMSSPEIGEPENDIPYHPWHEEMLHYARLALEPSSVSSTLRACTCHPDERIVPCQQKYAASECHSAWLLSLSSKQGNTP